MTEAAADGPGGRSPRRRVARQFAWVSGGRLLAAVLQALTLVFVARDVAPAEFGVLSVFLGVAAVAQTVIDCGVSTFIIRERAARPRSGDIAVAMSFNSWSSSALGLLTGTALLALGSTVNPIYLLMLPLAVWIGAQRNADNRLTIMVADGDAWINVTNLLTRRVAILVLLLTFSAIGLSPILGYSIASAVACVGSSIFANLYVRKRIEPKSDLTFRALIQRSSHYWIHSVATQARNLDALIVGLFAGATQAGLYSSGSRLINPLRILPTSLSVVLMPEATRAYANSRSLGPFVKLSGLMVLITVAMTAVLLAGTPLAVNFALGAEYEPAIPAIQAIIAGLPLWAAISLLQTLMQSIGMKKTIAGTSTVFTVVTLIGVGFAAAGWGAFGAAVALTASLVFQAGYLGVQLSNKLRRKSPDATDTPDSASDD